MKKSIGIIAAILVAGSASGCSLFDQAAPADIPELPAPTVIVDPQPNYTPDPPCPRYRHCVR